MTKEELKKLVDHEAQWLRYYALAEDRTSLRLDDVNFYDRLRSIGYTKRVIPLDRRCAAAMLTSPTNILTDSLESITPIGSPRNHDHNLYTPLEVWILKFPEDTQWILTIISGG